MIFTIDNIYRKICHPRQKILGYIQNESSDGIVHNVRAKIAAQYIHGEGIEIGALHVPLRLPPKASVKYVDRLSQSEGSAYADIEPVVPDIVEDGQTLKTISDSSLDFVVANHVIEHTDDPITAIQNWLRVLRGGGIVFVSGPDKRYATVDQARPETPFSHLLRDFNDGPEWSRHEHYREWAIYYDHASETEIEQRVKYYDENFTCGHFHVWKRQDFRTMLNECRFTLLFPFKIEKEFINNHEFVFVLRKF